MSERVFLAVDLGAESGRVIAGRLDGGRVRLEELHRFPNGPVKVAGTRRWDVLRLWCEIQDGLAVAARKYGSRIVSVGVDTWGVDYVLLSERGEVLGQPYHYRDPRTSGMLEQAFTKVPRARIFAQTGLQFMEINTLYQLHRDAAVRTRNCWRWLIAFLMMPDFFHWLLCGSRVVEFTNATTTQFFHPTQPQLGDRPAAEVRHADAHLPGSRAAGHEARPASRGCRRAHGPAADRRRRPGDARHGSRCRRRADGAHRPGELGLHQFGGTWSLIGVEVQQRDPDAKPPSRSTSRTKGASTARTGCSRT